MTATLGLALLLELVGLAALRHRLGKMWLRRPVTLLYLGGVISQGLSAVLLAFPSAAAQDTTLDGTMPRYLAEAALLTSAAMLALAIAYLLTQPQRVSESGPARIPAFADWRLLAAACVPLAAVTYEGRGYNGSVSVAGAGTPLATDLAVSFFVLLVILTSFSFVQRHGRGWFLPVLAVQCAVLAAAGERTPVLAGAIALALLLARDGMRPSLPQICTTTALTAVAVVAIMGARAAGGRTLFYADSGASGRVSALAVGLTSPGAQGPGLAAQAVERLDGNSFTAAILQAQALGQPRMDAGCVPESVLLTVPSALWPSKLSHECATSPAQAQIDGFGLQQVNFLPTLPGLYTGFLPWPWLLGFMALLGALAGWGERWLLRSRSPAHLVMLAGAVVAAVDYQEGLPGMLADLRGAAVIAMALWALERARSHYRARAALTCSPVP
jgi:hypothetical protein